MEAIYRTADNVTHWTKCRQHFQSSPSNLLDTL